ncbi:MAG: hypothetical protein WD904_01345 [Dehalococcoidia bacterium]
MHLLPTARSAAAHHLCPNTGSPSGPFDIQTYEALDYRESYARALELAGYNLVSPENAGFALPGIETGLRNGPQGVAVPYVPPVILKSIAYLESGWAQASYTPLVDYGETGPVLASHDCGYGVMQVTTGMQNISGVPNLDQAMIGTHYAFNMVRGARILADKWNMSPEYRPAVGDRNPNLIENWYYAIWGYNGFAYSNHPLNPAYQTTRVQYSCGTADDGYGHDRTQYPYQELVLGCVQRPPFRAGSQLWPPQDVHLPELTEATFAVPLSLENWNPCSYNLNCAAMDMPTPNTWHTDATVLNVTRDQILGTPTMSLSSGGANVSLDSTTTATTVGFDVINAGTGVLGYQALSDSSWLKVSPAAGVALGSDLGARNGAITVTVNATGMTPGNYTAHVTLSSRYVANPPSTFTVNLTMGTPAPTPAHDGKWGDNNCTQAPPDPVDSLLTLRHDAGLDANTQGCPGIGAELHIATVFIWGDVDCNGQVNPVDSLKILRFDAAMGVQQEPGCPAMGAAIVFPG